MKSLIVLLISLSPVLAQASEDWFCTTQSSHRMGNVIQTCGMGQAFMEAESRKAALAAAKDEFEAICEQDSSCKGHKVTVEPKRQTCENHAYGVRCYRMVEYTIVEEAKPVQKIESTEAVSTSDVASEDNSQIHKGMTKEDLIKRYGQPDFVLPVDSRYLIVNYTHAPFCISRCAIGFDNGRVYKFSGFTNVASQQ